MAPNLLRFSASRFQVEIPEIVFGCEAPSSKHSRFQATLKFLTSPSNGKTFETLNPENHAQGLRSERKSVTYILLACRRRQGSCGGGFRRWTGSGRSEALVLRVLCAAGALQTPADVVEPHGDADADAHPRGADAQADCHAAYGRPYRLRIRTHGALRGRHGDPQTNPLAIQPQAQPTILLPLNSRLRTTEMRNTTLVSATSVHSESRARE